MTYIKKLANIKNKRKTEIMKKLTYYLGVLILLNLNSLTAVNAQSLPDNIDISTSPNGIVALPASVPSIFASNGFVKYTKIQCPNGEAIHFIAQNLISDAQICYSRALLEFYLTDFAGSQYGANKTAVKNTMGTNNAMLMLVNGTHVEGQEPNINAQGLYQNEISVPGHSWYQTSDYDNHRDAAFEEILHLMHDMGIGVDGPNSISNGALPAFQTEIRAAQVNAVQNNYAIWPIGTATDPSWYNDLDQENSLSQEYLASLIDSYYGLWGAWTGDPNTGMWGGYISHTRAEIQTEDPMGWALVPKYFSPFINVDMIIDPTFNGIFSMTFDAVNQYTHKSQYLQHCYLDGVNNSGLQGNDEYNRLKGNSGNNSFEGLKGNDRLDGQGGSNTAIFTGDFSEYTVNNLTTYAIVTDGIPNRDGMDTLWNIHFLQFNDQTIPISLQNTVGIEDFYDEPVEVSLFPNPANNQIELQLGEISSKSVVEIFDLNGRKLIIKNFQHSQNLKIDVSEFSTGTYIIHLNTNDRTVNLKWIKK
jgi:hypothetical protein